MYYSYRWGFGTKYTSPLRIFDNFNSKAKTIATNVADLKAKGHDRKLAKRNGAKI